jgi:hypothetical protein
MSQIIIYNVPISEDCPSGVSIDIPSGEISHDEIIKKLHPQASNVKIVGRDTIPQDRYFRDAWKHNGETIDVDMIRGKSLHINKLRSIRDKKLLALDAEYMKALEKSDKSSIDSISKLKQSLRDMPTDAIFDSAKTPDELKNIIPTYLRE